MEHISIGINYRDSIVIEWENNGINGVFWWDIFVGFTLSSNMVMGKPPINGDLNGQLVYKWMITGAYLDETTSQSTGFVLNTNSLLHKIS